MGDSVGVLEGNALGSADAKVGVATIVGISVGLEVGTEVGSKVGLPAK